MARRTKKTRYNFPPVEGLYYGSQDAKARDRDWSEGYTETWDYVAASRCEKCGQVVFGVTEGDYPMHKEADPDSSCTGHVSGASSPMMNSIWPLDHRGSAEEAAAAIVDLPLCVVTDKNGEVEGLALTGGGMDLSWEIAEAYMRLGELPPVSLRLPEMAGRGEDARDEWIVAGMQRSIKAMQGSLQDSLQDLDRMLISSQENKKHRIRAGVPRRASAPHGRCTGRTCVENIADPNVLSCKKAKSGKGRRTS